MRIPRIKGLTTLSIMYQRDLDYNSYKRCILHIISHYTNNGFTYNGISLSLPQLSMYLNVKEDTFQSLVLETTNLYSVAFRSSDLDAQSGLRATLFSEILHWILSDKASINHLKTLVLNELQYPTTKNLKLPHAHLLVKVIESDAKLHASILNLLGQAFPAKNQTNILQIKASSEASKEPLITQKEAAELLGPIAQKALNDPDFLASLAEENDIHNPDLVPEVRASGSLDKDGTFIKSSIRTLIPDTLDSIHYSIDSTIDDEAEDLG